MGTAEEVILRSLDDAPLTWMTAGQCVDGRTRDRRRLQPILRLPKCRARLEYIAQQMVGRNVADAPRVACVQDHVIGAQPRTRGSPQHRGLVDAGRKPP